jgi:hypothetical protein
MPSSVGVVSPSCLMANSPRRVVRRTRAKRLYHVQKPAMPHYRAGVSKGRRGLFVPVARLVSTEACLLGRETARG